MKRRLTKLAVFLLLGTVVNVGVAWSCGVWSVGAQLYNIYFDLFEPTQVNPRDERWLRDNGWIGRQDETLTAGYLRAFGYSRVEYFSIPTAMFDPSKRSGSTGSYSAVVARTWCGWPLFSFCAEEWLDPETYERWLHGEIVRLPELYHYVGGIPVAVEVEFGGPIKMERVLPLRPIWPSFAINTIFYAVLVWCVTLVPFTARRFIRNRRGHCIKCGYDLRGDSSAGCPECGWRREESSS